MRLVTIASDSGLLLHTELLDRSICMSSKAFYVLGCPVVPFVCQPVHSSPFARSDIVTTIFLEHLNNFDKTDREYSLAPTDHLIRFWKSKIKVTAGLQGQIL